MAKRLITSTLAVLLLAGCAVGTGAQLDSVKNMSPNASDPFEVNLYQNYIDLADVQVMQGDLTDRDHFTNRAERIARGRNVDPELVICRDLSAPKVIELTNARTDLLIAFDNRSRLTAPKWVAMAQSYYDCWIEEEEDGNNPARIQECRDGFYAAMAKLQAMYPREVRQTFVASAPIVVQQRAPMTFEEKKQIATDSFIVYFDHDKSNLRYDALITVKDVLDAMNTNSDLRLALRGHTDRTGSDDYNDALSARRSLSVVKWFNTKGISAEVSKVSSFGEKVPAIFTNDNVREAKNRRVEIILY